MHAVKRWTLTTFTMIEKQPVKKKKKLFFPQSNTNAIVEIGYLLLDQIPTYRCKEYLCLNNKLPDREALKPHRHMVLFT